MKMRKKLLFLVSLFMCSSFFSYSKNPTINDATIASSTAKVLKQKEEDSDVVFTYLDVLNQYYEKAVDQAFIDLSSFVYTDVYISKKWFADSIACCTDDDGYHFITYANQLDSLTKKMMIKHSVKSIFISVKG